MPRAEVAARFGIASERVKQIKVFALKKLESLPETHDLRRWIRSDTA